jgi:hypothetical protein
MSKPNLPTIKPKAVSTAETKHSKVKTTSAKANKRTEEFKPASMFSLLNEKQADDILLDDEVKKLDRLMLINASARYELITANSMLLDFHLNRVMRAKGKKKVLNASPSQAFTKRNTDL